MERKIKEWYKNAYPSDPCGEDIDEDVTFQDLFDALDHYKDVYAVIFGNPVLGDSIVRERCFRELASIMDVDYGYIYDQWLLSA